MQCNMEVIIQNKFQIVTTPVWLEGILDSVQAVLCLCIVTTNSGG